MMRWHFRESMQLPNISNLTKNEKNTPLLLQRTAVSNKLEYLIVLHISQEMSKVTLLFNSEVRATYLQVQNISLKCDIFSLEVESLRP